MSNDYVIITTVCPSCSKFFPIKNMSPCQCCKRKVCSKCSRERDILFFDEWLYDCSNKCTKCQKIGCGRCIKTCFQCNNMPENRGPIDFLCRCCAQEEYKTSKCEYHNWTLCKKHYDGKCSQCKANKNYSRYDF